MFELTYRGRIQAQQRPRMAVRKNKGKSYATVYEAKESRDFKSSVHYMAQKVLESSGLKPYAVECRLVLVAYIKMPNSFSKKKKEEALTGQLFPTRKPDIDNVLKSVMDAVNGVFYDDDKLVAEVRASKRYANHDGLYMYVERLSEEYQG